MREHWIICSDCGQLQYSESFEANKICGHGQFQKQEMINKMQAIRVMQGDRKFLKK